MTARTRARTGRARPPRVGALVAAVVGIFGLGACSSAGPEGGVTTEDVQELEDQINSLDERVGVLEEDGALPEDIDDESPEAIPDEFFTETDVYVGQDVTVSAEVTEMVATVDAGSAFRIGGDAGDPVLVVSTDPPDGLEDGDVVRVSGSVLVLREDTFEQQFGVAADEVFDDPDTFFGGEEDQVGIAADELEVLPE